MLDVVVWSDIHIMYKEKYWILKWLDCEEYFIVYVVLNIFLQQLEPFFTGLERGLKFKYVFIFEIHSNFIIILNYSFSLAQSQCNWLLRWDV